MLKLKRVVCGVLVAIMCISSSLSALASNGTTRVESEMINKEVKMQIVKALQDAEPIKEEMGLENVDYYNLYVSNAISTYDYTEKGLVKNSTKYYPLKFNDVVVAWAIEYEDCGEIFYQISTALVQEVCNVVDNNTPFAFVFDKNGSYLYDGISIKHLKDSIYENEERAVIQSLSDILKSDIEVNNMNASEKLEYFVPVMARAQVLYKCSVKSVSQNPYKNICWAASIACIVNAIKGTSYTAVDVARKYHSYNNYNYTITKGIEASILKNHFSVSYSYKASSPTVDNVVYNISRNYPIYANFAASGMGHAVVIYGINTSTGVTYIMDPQNGFCTGRYNTTNKNYAYYKTDAQKTYTSNSVTCRYWK